MEKKNKHRILGFSVLAAMLVILYPFIEKEKGLPPQAEHYVAPPPFPSSQTAPASQALAPASSIPVAIKATTQKSMVDVTSINSMAWVVQVGVFKEKNNALKLVNELRANGYHAFMADAGESTKVFVGPENQQAAAHTLADRLEQEIHMRGIVVNYKPFTL